MRVRCDGMGWDACAVLTARHSLEVWCDRCHCPCACACHSLLTRVEFIVLMEQLRDRKIYMGECVSE